MDRTPQKCGLRLVEQFQGFKYVKFVGRTGILGAYSIYLCPIFGFGLIAERILHFAWHAVFKPITGILYVYRSGTS